jgi:hypothetical protein
MATIDTTIPTSPRSRRSVLVKRTDAGETLEVRSPAGDLELRITFDEDGPTVYARATRMALETSDTLALRCRTLEVNTLDGIRLASEGSLQLAGRDMRVKTAGDIDLNGDVIRLNC